MTDIISHKWDITQALLFVNEQALFHEKRAAKLGEKDFRRELHVETAAKFVALAAFLTELASTPHHTKPAAQAGTQLSLSLEDVQGLPQELLNELSISTSDWAEFDIMTIMNEAGGVLSLDKILIGLYKNNGEIHKRTAVNNRIYRMVGKGLLFNVPNRKGVYSTMDLSAAEAEALLNPVGTAP